MRCIRDKRDAQRVVVERGELRTLRRLRCGGAVPGAIATISPPRRRQRRVTAAVGHDSRRRQARRRGAHQLVLRAAHLDDLEALVGRAVGVGQVFALGDRARDRRRPARGRAATRCARARRRATARSRDSNIRRSRRASRRGEIALGARADFGRRHRQRPHVALAVQHGGGGRQRHFEAGQVIGPEERVVGSFAQLQVVHALAQARMAHLGDDEHAGRDARGRR